MAWHLAAMGQTKVRLLKRSQAWSQKVFLENAGPAGQGHSHLAGKDIIGLVLGIVPA